MSIDKHWFEFDISKFPVAVAIVDRNGVVIALNDHFSSRIGYSRSDLVGRPVSTLVPKRVRSKHDALIRAYFDAPAIRSMGEANASVSIIRPDGSEVPAEIGLIPCPGMDCAAAIVVPQGKPIGQMKRSVALAMVVLLIGLALVGAKQVWPVLNTLPDGQLLIGAAVGSLLALMNSSRTDNESSSK